MKLPTKTIPMPSLLVRRLNLSRLRHAALFIFCLALGFLLQTVATPVAWAELTAIKRGLRVEYPIPGRPLHVAVQEPGHIWFTVPDDDAVLRALGDLFSQRGGHPLFDNYTVLALGSQPYDLVYGDNTVWFTERGANKLARIDVITGVLTEYDVPTLGSAPTGIAVAPNGTIWFTEQKAGNLAHFDPVTESFEEYTLPTTQLTPDQLNPKDVALSNNNVVWLTVPAGNTVMAFNVNSARFFTSRFSTIQTPHQLVMDVQGRPWITAFGSSAIGKYSPGTLSLFDRLATPVENSGPADIIFLDNGDVWEFWYAQYNRGYVSRLFVQPQNSTPIHTKEYFLGAGTNPWGIARDSNNHIWVAENGRNVLSELQPPYSFDVYMPSMRRQE